MAQRRPADKVFQSTCISMDATSEKKSDRQNIETYAMIRGERLLEDCREIKEGASRLNLPCTS